MVGVGNTATGVLGMLVGVFGMGADVAGMAAGLQALRSSRNSRPVLMRKSVGVFLEMDR